MRRMTEVEDCAVSRVVGTWEVLDAAQPHEWEVRQGAFYDPIHLDLSLMEMFLYAIGGVVACVLSSFFPWGFA